MGFPPHFRTSHTNITREPCGLPAERLTLRPTPAAPAAGSLPGSHAARSPQPALSQAVAPGRPAQSPIGRRRRDPGTRRPGSRRRALEGPAAGASQRAATAGHEARSLAAPRLPGPRPHHKPQLARLWGTQSVTERAPGGARPRACPPFLGPGTRARHNKSPSVPPPAAAEGLTHIRGFESAARHVTRRQGGAGGSRRARSG